MTQPRSRVTAVTRGLAALTVLALAGVSACSSGETPPAPTPTPQAPVVVGGTVVATAGTANEMDVVVPDPIKSAWTELGTKGDGVELVTVAGDGTTTTAPTGLAGEGTAPVDALTAAVNGADSTTAGRSVLAGLEAIDSPEGDPVWVFSPMLDTEEPLDFRQLAFDESPSTVVKAVKKADAMPSLKGRDITFVVTPVAGEQKALSKLQIGYQRAVWEGLAKAAGAKEVTFFDGTSTTPGQGTGAVVSVPDPEDKINAEKDGKTSTCTLPSPALFVSDQPALIDKKATLKALKDCVGDLKSSTTITVEGHTAGVSGSDNAFAKTLSTQRATEVAALLKELDVPAKNITKVVGYGSSKPIVDPSSDPRNRAVVVTFTTQE